MTLQDLDHAAEVLGKRAQRNRPIGPLTTYRVGGDAALFVEVGSDDDLEAVVEALRGTQLPVLVLGRGSNLLVRDAGFEGIAVHLGDEFAWVDVESTTVRAGGAASLPVVARRAAAAGLTGIEWAVGVPGSVGGAVRMNAGGHGSGTSDVLLWARLVDLRQGSEWEAAASELDFAYRRSCVGADRVVTEACFGLERGDRRRSGAEIGEIVRWRRENQPGGQNAGSVFMNPPGDSAGRLVEAAGLKGHRVGSAEVSTKHANFFQADPGGSADDVVALIEEVRELVLERTGVDLELEVRIVGDVAARGGA